MHELGRGSCCQLGPLPRAHGVGCARCCGGRGLRAPARSRSLLYTSKGARALGRLPARSAQAAVCGTHRRRQHSRGACKEHASRAGRAYRRRVARHKQQLLLGWNAVPARATMAPSSSSRKAVGGEGVEVAEIDEEIVPGFFAANSGDAQHFLSATNVDNTSLPDAAKKYDGLGPPSLQPHQQEEPRVHLATRADVTAARDAVPADLAAHGLQHSTWANVCDELEKYVDSYVLKYRKLYWFFPGGCFQVLACLFNPLSWKLFINPEDAAKETALSTCNDILNPLGVSMRITGVGLKNRQARFYSDYFVGGEGDATETQARTRSVRVLKVAKRLDPKALDDMERLLLVSGHSARVIRNGRELIEAAPEVLKCGAAGHASFWKLVALGIFNVYSIFYRAATIPPRNPDEDYNFSKHALIYVETGFIFLVLGVLAAQSVPLLFGLKSRQADRIHYVAGCLVLMSSFSMMLALPCTLALCFVATAPLCLLVLLSANCNGLTERWWLYGSDEADSAHFVQPVQATAARVLQIWVDTQMLLRQCASGIWGGWSTVLGLCEPPRCTDQAVSGQLRRRPADEVERHRMGSIFCIRQQLGGHWQRTGDPEEVLRFNTLL